MAHHVFQSSLHATARAEGEGGAAVAREGDALLEACHGKEAAVGLHGAQLALFHRAKLLVREVQHPAHELLAPIDNGDV